MIRYLAAMLLVAGAFFDVVARADVLDELSDLAARIDYGFYARDPVVLDGAREELAGMTGTHALIDYYRAYAEYRIAQQPDRIARSGGAADDCVRLAESATRDRSLAAEAWILVAACAGIAAEDSSLTRGAHERRHRQALERAREVREENPRLLLVAALGAAPGSGAEPADLEAAIDAFRAWPAPFELPNWGEADALAALAAARLRRGDVRAARDAIERALLIAPDYADALSLQRRLRQ